jgi:hypothetical protein
MGIEKTPVDELTGIPMLFVPHWDLGLLMKSASRTGRFSDWNHAYFPRLSPDLRGAAGLAVRYARVQRVARHEHDKYHEWFDAPPLPKTLEEKFRAVVLCAAGYVPPVAINMGYRTPRQEPLGFRQIRRLRTSGELTVDRPHRVRRFMKEFILDQQIEGVENNRKLVSDFLLSRSGTDYDRKRQADMARSLLSITARGVVAGLEDGYAFGYQNDLLAPDVPEEALDFVVDEVAGDNIYAMRPLIDALQDKLIGMPLGGLALQAA